MPNLLQIVIFTVIVGSPFSGCRHQIEAMHTASSSVSDSAAIINAGSTIRPSTTASVSESGSVLQFTAPFGGTGSNSHVPKMTNDLVTVSPVVGQATIMGHLSTHSEESSNYKLTGELNVI